MVAIYAYDDYDLDMSVDQLLLLIRAHWNR